MAEQQEHNNHAPDPHPLQPKALAKHRDRGDEGRDVLLSFFAWIAIVVCVVLLLGLAFGFAVKTIADMLTATPL